MQRRPGVLVVGGSGTDEGVRGHVDDGGFEVTSVGGLDAALDALATATFDCVVCAGDVGDGGEGDDLAEVVRSVREAQSDLPVVIYAGEDDEAADSGIVAAGLADLVRRTGEADRDRLLGRIRNAVARRQAVRRAERQARLNEVIRHLNRVLVRADSRDEIEDGVCEELARSEQYNFAWIAGVEDDLTLRSMGVEGGSVEARGAVSVDEGTAFTEPVRQAAAEREVVVVRDVEGRGGAWEAALGRAFEAVAAVPFVYEDRLYGVLVLYTDRANAFDEEEQRVLGELGENIAYAMNAVAVRRRMALRERELRRQNERLEQFASVVSHDLRNPLNVARGYVEIIQAEGDDGLGEYTDEVDESLDRMETIIADVLDLARQGETIDDPGAVSLAPIAKGAWNNVATGAATLETADATLLADDDRLSRLLENLFRNAVEHAFGGSPDEAGAVESEASPVDGAVRVGPIAEDGDVVGFFVEDDGPGVPEAERENVLEMGYTSEDGGTGFGLAIVGEIAAAHGWEATVTAGSGTRTDAGTYDGARFEFTGVETPGGRSR